MKRHAGKKSCSPSDLDYKALIEHKNILGKLGRIGCSCCCYARKGIGISLTGVALTMAIYLLEPGMPLLLGKAREFIWRGLHISYPVTLQLEPPDTPKPPIKEDLSIPDQVISSQYITPLQSTAYENPELFPNEDICDFVADPTIPENAESLKSLADSFFPPEEFQGRKRWYQSLFRR